MTQQSTVRRETGSAKETLRTATLAEFQAVRRSRQYEQVAKQIQQLVFRGVLKPGDRLPAERELATKFGVSRSSVRDAIRTLEVIGIVEPHQGKGTVVRELSTDSLVVPLTRVLLRKRELVAELLDVRKMIEPALASRAAENATAEEIGRMEIILRRQQEKLRRGEETIEEDSEFHYVIALAAGNSVVLKVLHVLMDLLRESRARSLQVLGRRERSYAGHRQILRAIKRRDGAAAASAARQHLKEIEEITMRKL
jgi:GntR family transcriptional repressor for pyruvate dehydrogenase complex